MYEYMYVGVTVGEFRTQNCFEKDPEGIRDYNGYLQRWTADIYWWVI